MLKHVNFFEKLKKNFWTVKTSKLLKYFTFDSKNLQKVSLIIFYNISVVIHA